MSYKELKDCLVCGRPMHIYQDFGSQPLANNLKTAKDDPDQRFPLIVAECHNCTHKQLSIAVDRELLFKNYLYKTGVSRTHIDYFADFAVSVRKGNCRGIRPKTLDIGCNDGSLLICFQLLGWDVLGIDPAASWSEKFSEHTIPIIKDFFPPKEPLTEKFDCITAFNVFAHNGNPEAFLAAMRDLLNPEGRIYIQTTLARLDSLYHEHVSYFTPGSMAILAAKCDLIVRSIKETSMHGRSYLFELSHKDQPPMAFHQDVYTSSGPRIGYGASANGIVLLNYFSLAMEYVIDDNPLKQNKFIPGVNVPIYGSEYLAADLRDLNIVILAYNLFEEIVEKIKKLRPLSSDKFIHALEGAK